MPRRTDRSEFDAERWASSQEPLLLPKEVPWFHGSDAPDLEGKDLYGESFGGSFFTHDVELARSYGRNVYEVAPPADTRRWDVAHELLEAEYDPEYAAENPAHAYDQVTSAFFTRDPLPVKRAVPEEEARERSRFVSPQFGRAVRPQDLWGRALDDERVPQKFEGGKYRPFREDEWDPEVY